MHVASRQAARQFAQGSPQLVGTEERHGLDDLQFVAGEPHAVCLEGGWGGYYCARSVPVVAPSGGRRGVGVSVVRLLLRRVGGIATAGCVAW